jgi:hypothetical protein
MNAQELLTSLDQRSNEVAALTKLWQVNLSECPPERQFKIWLELHTFETAVHGVREAAKKFSKLNGAMDLDRLVRFASGVMNARKSRMAAHHADAEKKAA